jgi:hypothetical protein
MLIFIDLLPSWYRSALAAGSGAWTITPQPEADIDFLVGDS